MIWWTHRERATLWVLCAAALIGLGVNVYRQQRARIHVELAHPAETSRRLEAALDQGRRLSLNTSTAAELERLPGIGPSLAERIVGYRDAHGPFASVDELRHVRGIGHALLTRLHDDLTL